MFLTVQIRGGKKMKIKLMMQLVILVVFMMVCFHTLEAAAQSAPRISKEQLLDMLENPDVVVIDVRTTGNWQESDLKIKGAKREVPKKIDSWAGEYAKDKLLVLY
jgi:predicted sulfurtransferase